ncbi:methylated-DNA--[protein]-cysteine S-methyltransferase [Maridesulfovibrio zosterae]|uniref:methylated-DNA--[protein]-cysteine S-methyltransferase n=1 Tax=Maridesulfovibrio zosterae TaxID=82171 RepID=UPI000421449D|nr:methylated-DNA--[protein]-cysteine S-methyltransferase [Maridesulfovibrio zosterae]
MSVYFTKFDSVFCEIILVGNENGLSHLHLQTGEGRREFDISDKWIRNDEFFVGVIRQIKDFLSGKTSSFKVKLNPQGTDFQKKVWGELCKIPIGQTRTYKDIAQQIGNRNASRAVGMANSKNPIPLIIPCHRVIGSNGKLTGFAHGLRIKQQLIDLEEYWNNQKS